MEKFWHELQFNPVAPVEVPFKADLFRSPTSNITTLRRLARKGRRRLDYSMREQEGRPKLVLGIPNDAQTVAPLRALAHGPVLVQTVSRSNLDAVDNTATTNLSGNQKQTTRKPKKPQTAAKSDRRADHTGSRRPRGKKPSLRTVTPRAATTSPQRRNQSKSYRRTKGDHA
jgi:hypothetical protein